MPIVPPDNRIESASSLENGARRHAIASLEANRIDPKMLYVTPHQADHWREVFLRHSPIHSNPDFARIYQEAFALAAGMMAQPEVLLIGLGCGTGMKEAQLCRELKARGLHVLFSSIDISRDLIEESRRNLVSAGAVFAGAMVCNLGEVDQLAGWIGETGSEAPSLFTFFGLVPNLAPALVMRLFRAILQPGDVLMVSVHLAPIGEAVDIAAAMHRVLPQYDNPETLAWLRAGLEEWGLENLVDAPGMTIGEVGEIPAFVAQARWKSSKPFEKWGHTFFPDPQHPLQVFHSLRYTPALFEDLLSRHGFQFERLAITTCREEAIWSVQLRP